MADSKQNLIDLYQLLELSPLESDLNRIQAALKRVLKIAKEANDPQVAKRAAKLLELGKQNLLSAERKAAYDARWQTAYGGVAEKEVAAEPPETLVEDWNWSELEPVLPAGDYSAEFDLPAFLEHAATLPPQNIAADYGKLQTLLGGAPVASATAPNPTAVPATDLFPDAQSTPSAPNLALPTSQSAQASQSSPASSVLSSPTTPPAPSTTSTSPQPSVSVADQPANNAPRTGSMARKLRKKRDRSLLLASGGLLASVAAILGLIFFLVNRDKDNGPDLAGQPNPPQANGPVPVVRPTDPAPRAPARSGLQIPNMPEELKTNPAPTEPPDMGPIPDTSTETPPDMPEPQPMPPAEPPTVRPAAPPEPKLTAAERSAWLDKLRAVSQQLGQQQYAESESELAALVGQAKTKEQREELARLTKVAQLAAQCHQALIQSIQSLGAAETFNVGSRQVSFVEGDEEKIIVKIGGPGMGGSSTTFKLTELPVGIFEGLVDLTLDLANETALAKRAAFILFHPKNNDLALKKAVQRMEAAENVGSVPKGTVQIFEAEYLRQ